MSVIKVVLEKKSVRLRDWAGMALLTVCLLFPASLLGDSLVRSISLEANEADKSIRVPVGTKVKVQNNYPQELYQTSVITELSNKKVLSIETFHTGQSFGLEFTKKGAYSVCYSLKPEKDSASPICLQINVVPLQAA